MSESIFCSKLETDRLGKRQNGECDFWKVKVLGSVMVYATIKTQYITREKMRERVRSRFTDSSNKSIPVENKCVSIFFEELKSKWLS